MDELLISELFMKQIFFVDNKNFYLLKFADSFLIQLKQAQSAEQLFSSFVYSSYFSIT